MHTLFATLQLADSFFPTGMFTQSHGLESFIAAGTTGVAQIEPLLHSYLLHIAALGDALAARWVARAAHAGDLDLVAQIVGQAPRVDAGPAQTVECTAATGTPVTLHAPTEPVAVVDWEAVG